MFCASLLFGSSIYQQQITTFSTLAGVKHSDTKHDQIDFGQKYQNFFDSASWHFLLLNVPF
jgi:hypothetical protein